MLFSRQIDFKISPSVWDPMFSVKILDSHDSSFHEGDLSTPCASESFPHRWHNCQVAGIIWPEIRWVCGTHGVQSVQHTTALPLISGTAAAKKLPSRHFLLYLSFWGRSFYVTQKTLSSGSLSPLWGVAAGGYPAGLTKLASVSTQNATPHHGSLAQRIIPREAQETASPATQSLTQVTGTRTPLVYSSLKPRKLTLWPSLFS